MNREQILNAVGPGWSKLLTKLLDDLSATDFKSKVVQVKEKFGGLRFYYEPVAVGDKVFDLVHAAEDESYKICEFCGEPGHVRSFTWIKTLCDKCDEAWAKKHERKPEYESVIRKFTKS